MEIAICGILGRDQPNKDDEHLGVSACIFIKKRQAKEYTGRKISLKL